MRDSQKKAYCRWEFLRRNKDFIADYQKKIGISKNLIDLELATYDVQMEFLKKYNSYPMNPCKPFEEILKVYNDYTNQLSKSASKPKKKKRKVSREELMKSIEEFKKKTKDEGMNTVFRSHSYIRTFLKHISNCKLYANDNRAYVENTTIENSYLTEDPALQAFRWGNSFGLADASIDDFGTDPFVEEYSGDLTKVCIELDVSYPTSQIIKDVKREISTWKKIGKELRGSSSQRQHLDFRDVQKIVKVYDLRMSGMTYKNISMEVFESTEAHAIQRTRNMYKKAKKYIQEGGYKQIR